MEGIRQYAVSVTGAALVCSILSMLMPKGPSKELLRLLCGLALGFAVLRPLGNLELDALLSLPVTQYQEAGKLAAGVGEDIALKARADIIKFRSEAYILDKASVLSAELEADVFISETEPLVPVSAELKGRITPYARQCLEEIIETDLGIAKENQLWTG